MNMVSLVIMFTLVRFVFYMKFFKLLCVSLLGNKRAFRLWNICSDSTSLK